MPHSNAWTDQDSSVSDDRGVAALEFIVVGCLLLVPLVYLIVALGAIQGQALGVESAARHAARVMAQSVDAADAADRSRAVLALTIDEYGLDPDSVAVEVTCRPVTGECPAAGATVVVTVSSQVQLPLVPPVLGLERLTSIPIEASAVQRISRFWGASS